MRQYEMMIILDPSLEERTVQPSLDQFLTVVTSAGGTVDKVDVWGRRRLAYEIDKKSEGIYTVIELKAEPDTVKELDRQLNLNEAVLRTKILRPDQHRARSRPSSIPVSTSSISSPTRASGSTPMAAGDTTITIIGNLVNDPELRYTPTGQAVSYLPGCIYPAVPGQADERVEGRRLAVPVLQRVAAGRGKRGRVPPARDARHRLRPATAAVVRGPMEGGRSESVYEVW